MYSILYIIYYIHSISYSKTLYFLNLNFYTKLL